MTRHFKPRKHSESTTIRPTTDAERAQRPCLRKSITSGRCELRALCKPPDNVSSILDGMSSALEPGEKNL